MSNTTNTSTSMQEGMMSVLGLATNVGGRVADVEVSAPRVPAQSIHSDDEVSFSCLFEGKCLVLY